MDATPQVMKIKLSSTQQLFNSLDPTPFPEKDLDDNVEQFIVNWAKTLSPSIPFQLQVLIPASGVGQDEQHIEEGIQHYFEYRRQLARRELFVEFRTARTAILIGMMYLIPSISLAISLPETGPTMKMMKECLFIFGWVAVWKPLDMFLFDWWPVRRAALMYKRLSEMDVVIKIMPEKPDRPDQGQLPLFGK